MKNFLSKLTKGLAILGGEKIQKEESDTMREFFNTPSKIPPVYPPHNILFFIKGSDKPFYTAWPEYTRDSKGNIIPIPPSDRIEIH